MMIIVTLSLPVKRACKWIVLSILCFQNGTPLVPVRFLYFAMLIRRGSLSELKDKVIQAQQ